MKILSKIKGIYALIQFIITVFGTVVLMYMFRKKHRMVRQKWARLERFLINYNINVKGEIDKEAQLVVVNHQSVLDIVVLEELYPKDLCWVAKKEIENIPFFGHVIKAPHMISVVRSDKRALVKLLKDVKDRLARGRVIAIFPEGTRSNGNRLLKFQQGTKFIAEKLNLKILPVVITGSINVFDSKKLEAYGKDITVNFLPSVTPQADTSWYKDLHVSMEKVLKDELANSSSHR